MFTLIVITNNSTLIAPLFADFKLTKSEDTRSEIQQQITDGQEILKVVDNFRSEIKWFCHHLHT